MDVTKRCSAEIKQAHKQFAGHMTKIIRKLSYTSDSIVACVTGQCGQLCKKHSLVCSAGRKAAWKAKFLPPGTKLHPNNEDLRKLRECIHLRLCLCACLISALQPFVTSIENLARTLSCSFLLIPGNICLLKSPFFTSLRVHVKLPRMKHLLLLDNSLPMVTPLQALDLKEVNKDTVPYTLKT
jgi:hypothetical protein